MKKLLAVSVAVATACAAMVASAGDYIAHWDFSSDALGEFDITGHNDLVNSNGVAIADGAAVFDGTAKELITGHYVDFHDYQSYTIECFVQADEDCDGMIMEHSPNINDNNVRGVFYLYAKEGVVVKGKNGTYNGEQFDDGNVCDGQWHHIAVIVAPTTTAVDQVQLYLDGVRQTKHVHSNADSCLRPHRLYIGSRGGTSVPFKGKIDDVRITEGVLDPSEFLQARSADTINVRAYWKFDEGNAIADSSGNGNTLQGSQGVVFTNGCASFDGTANDVRTANKLDLSAYTDVTIEFFIRKHVGVDTLGMVLEHSPNYWNNRQGFYLTLSESRVGAIQGNFRFDNGYHYGISPIYAVNAGWHHVALVKNSSKAGTDECISLYVDGVRKSEYVGDSSLSSGNLLNHYLYFGSRNNADYFLNADIDDVRITANVLVPGQFLRTRTGPIDDVIAYWPFDAANMFEDASGNGNVLTGSGVTVNDVGAAVFGGLQNGFATLAPLPLCLYESMTVEWFMKSSMSGAGIVLETSADYSGYVGAFYAAANEYAGYNMLTDVNVLSGWSAMDGNWHHYALVYDRDETTADIVRLYCDGVKVATHHRSETGGPKLWSDKLFIGARNGSKYRFVGELDDIKITGRALAPAEFMTKRSKPPRGMTISIK